MSHHPPKVELGEHQRGGLAPAIMAIVDRGVQRRPVPANQLRAVIELNLADQYPPVRIRFGEHHVLVEDGAVLAPDLRVSGALPDLVGLLVAPLVGGLPNPINRRGWNALGMVAGRRVRIEGRLGLMRQFLGIIRI
jgi:hypothetical protein